MMFARFKTVLIGILLPAAMFPAHARAVSMAARLDAQRAILEFRVAHQSPGTPPREIPQGIAEDQVLDYLRQSAALEQLWGTPVTAEMLAHETERMARRTRMPDRLEALYDVLGNDPTIFRECVARPALVTRLVQARFARDRRIHGAQYERARAVRAAILSGEIDPSAPLPERRLEEWWRAPEERRCVDPLCGSVEDGVLRRPLSTEQFERSVEMFAGERQPTEIRESREGFEFLVLLGREPGRVQVARFRFPKISWSEWWAKNAGRFDPLGVRSVADDAPLPRPTGFGGDTTEDVTAGGQVCQDYWDNGSLDDVPEGRTGSVAVWTGEEAVFWGGGDNYLNTGGRYDPIADTWAHTSTEGAPEGRKYHTAVWTGSEMIVWGGEGFSALQTGGRYDPVTDSWRPVSTVGAPEARSGHSAVWTGSEMIVWGGRGYWGDRLSDGARYDPTTDTWTPISDSGAPQARAGHTAVWTGSHMLIWGGEIDYQTPLGSGGSYDPASDTWSDLPKAGAPSPRYSHTAVWTGSYMVIWGGKDDKKVLDSGARYDPARNKWLRVSSVQAPIARAVHTAVWSGSEMIVWGGSKLDNSLDQALNSGGRYDPEADRWRPTSTEGAPSGRTGHAAVFGAGLMIIWGGAGNTGGRYDPVSDTWEPTSTAGAPEARTSNSAVWTGTYMVVWGGWSATRSGLDPHSLNTGSRYDPVLDAWFPTTTVGAPSPRQGHLAVWTGTRMIVWGGQDEVSTPLGDGASYDPVGDTWSPISNVGAPSPRRWPGGVWTGSDMIVWGGQNLSGDLRDGGIYSPETDSWTPVTEQGAPSARSGHPSVWTGSEMIVWGGEYDDYGDLGNTGGRYDPATDTWRPTTLDGAPGARAYHTLVWTGSRMIVWGGWAGGSYDWRDGSSYDPVNDAWTPIDLPGAPSFRERHSAVWTGSHMIVWGGRFDKPLDTGGVYDPVRDAWTETTVVDAPQERASHNAVWTGEQMIVWGGGLNNGGRYVPDERPAPSGSPALRMEKAPAATLVWDVLDTATAYDVVRGDLDTLRQTNGDYASATEVCLADDLGGTTLEDAEDPVPGGGYWYLVRGVNCGGPGTYDSGGAGQVGSRDPGIGASPAPCP